MLGDDGCCASGSMFSSGERVGEVGMSVVVESDGERRGESSLILALSWILIVSPWL